MATPTNLPAAQTTGNVLTAAYVNDLRGAFRVLQVVTADNSTQAINATNVLADTGLTATITPQSTTSKILVMVQQNGCYKNTGNAGSGLMLAVLRGATILTYPATGTGYTGANNSIAFSVGHVYLDSPNTTSAVTYKTQFANVLNLADVRVQLTVGFGTPASTICLMEISA
jgi:hypothetical protein